jgi:iron complex outermembrane receptor protein
MGDGNIMTKQNVPFAVLATFSALATGLLSATSTAQTATDSSNASQTETGGLTEIVVTAQRRSQSLQDVPISVNALTTDQLTRDGIAGIDDLAIAVPGLEVTDGAGYLFTHLRGVGAQTAGAGLENPVALYVDGVYYANQTVGIFSFNNVSQIEVLKGPQGTLFGRNATGGLIQVTTAEPTQDFQMKVDAGASNYHGAGGDLYVSGGITSNLAADVAIIGSRMDGYGTNLYNSEGVYAEPWNIAIRSKWVYTPGDWKATLIGDYSNTDNSYNSVAAKPGSYIVYPFVPAPGIGTNAWNTDVNVQPSIKQTDMGGSLKLERDFGSVKLSNLAAGRRSTFQSIFDDDGTPAPFDGVDIQQNDWQISDELQLASNSAGAPLTWVAGLYYFYDESEFAPTTITLGPTPALNPSYPVGHIVARAKQDTAAIAGFGQATYSFTDRLDLTAGLRYSHEHRILDDASQNGVLLFPGNPVVPLGPPIPEANSSFNDPSYRLSLDYKFTPNLMVYGSFNSGFKSGGYNASNPTDPPFSPEKLYAYEIGEKAEMLDHKLRVNSAVFYYNYLNMQIQKPEEFGSGIINGAKATLYGFDSEITAIPIAPLELSAGLSLLHTKFDDFPDAPISTPGGGVPTTIGSAAGNELPFSPKAVVNTSATYFVIPTLSITAIYSHSLSYYTAVDNVEMQPSFNMVNASVRWTTADKRFWIRVYGDNLSNAEVANKLTTPQGIILQTLQPPRVYGFKIGFTY